MESRNSMIACILSIKLQYMLFDTCISTTVHHSLTSTAAFQQTIIRLSTKNDLCAIDTNQYKKCTGGKPSWHLQVLQQVSRQGVLNIITYGRVSKLSAQVLQQHMLPVEDVWKHRPLKTMSASCPSVNARRLAEKNEKKAHQARLRINKLAGVYHLNACFLWMLAVVLCHDV